MPGGGKSNQSQIWQQQQDAEAARQKEQQRAARLQSGQQAINALFDGGSVMGTRPAPITWGGDTTPEGFTRQSIKKAGTPGQQSSFPQQPDMSATYGGNPDGGGGVPINYGPNMGAYGGTPDTFEDVLVGADGRQYRKGDVIGSGSESYDTGQSSGGFGEDFYNKFRQAQTDYYLPDVARQYGKAKDDLTFNLARAGTLNSSVAGDQLADLVYQNTNNVASVKAKADASTADLRQRVAQEKQNAISQLYATEDPSMAANDALARTRTISEVTPELSPLGDLFKLAAIGGGTFASASGSPYNRVTSGQTGNAGNWYNS